ncbi:hypothetical protein [Caldimonas brevitalea]|uniref:Uncharacterized protein n=1 Tax=Caldimonas brevitalea TaxID=413882 RepID=A0A0G3BCB2_9BURK|nr:hypothetical protein [Caldimonas brevitalea]AKJ27004.1 hypothetical protein AAW51_0313 [Caldimonas brevitalea]
MVLEILFIGGLLGLGLVALLTGHPVGALVCGGLALLMIWWTRRRRPHRRRHRDDGEAGGGDWELPSLSGLDADD